MLMKNILIVILFTTTCFAQVTQEWVQRYNGPGNQGDEAKAIAIDDEGNVYVTGYSFGAAANFDYATIKYNSDGVEQWVQRYNGPLNLADVAVAIAVDNEGNVYVTGYSFGAAANFDYATIKYNATGVEQWVQRYNGPGNYDDEANAIAVDNEGNVFVTGLVHITPSTFDCTTIKYNPDGVEQWVQAYNGPLNSGDRAYAIAVDNEGNVYVTGETFGGATNWNYVTIKYNSAGVEQWDQIYNGTGNSFDTAIDIAVDSEGNVFVTGYSVGSGTDYDYATIKYNSDGVEQWVQIYNGPGNQFDQAKAIAVDNEGNVYVTGLSNGGATTSWDYATIKYNSDGLQRWVQRYNDTGNQTDEAKAIAVDNEGNVYVTGGSDGDYATIKYSQENITITSPQAGEKWIAGETDSIKWTGGQAEQFLTIEYSTDNGQTYNLIDLAAPADSHYYKWNIPNTILSTKVKVKLSDFQTSAELVVSDNFKIKPYIITRMEDGEYVAYHRLTDAWNFSNDQPDMWPASWYNQFNYQGIDPFTGLQYSQWQVDSIFAKSQNSIHVDWVSWVNTFGFNECYDSTTLGVYKPSTVLWWKATRTKWFGSCFGIAVSNALAFSNKQQFLARYPNFPPFLWPITVASDTGVKRVVNELFADQWADPFFQLRIDNFESITPNQTLNQLKAMLREDTVSIRVLIIGNNNGAGGHGILAYSLEQDETQKELYYVFVYDNSVPNNLNSLILIDTTGNSNQGTWLSTYAWQNWGGSKQLMLGIESILHLNDATLLKNNDSPESQFVLAEDELRINTNINANTRIFDLQGNLTGFVSGKVFEEIPGSVPLIYINGSETPPYGYHFQKDNYSVVLDEFKGDTVETFFFTGNKSFVYERNGVIQTQTDRLFFDGGVSASNPDAEVKTIKLLNLINETTKEKLTVIRSLELAHNDSVKIENPDSNKVKLVSYGTAKDYDIELNYVTENGVGRFGDFNIALSANTSHTFVPDWDNVSGTQLTVLVDFGNDGTIDDTLYIENTVDVKDEGSLLSPNVYNLAQNYPNPFNPTTTIQYSIPQGSNVTLKVYDILGNEVAALVNEEKERGVYTVNFDASHLASGMYLYRLQAGSFVETKKMILIK